CYVMIGALAGLSGLRSSPAQASAANWPSETKVLIVAGSHSGQVSIDAVARGHGMSPSQLFTWCRELRKQMKAQGLVLPVSPLFVPAMVEPSQPCDGDFYCQASAAPAAIVSQRG